MIHFCLFFFFFFFLEGLCSYRLALFKAAYCNDGYYGNGASWIGGSAANQWVSFDLGTPTAFDRVVVGRDRVSNVDDRDPGTLSITAGNTTSTDVAIWSLTTTTTPLIGVRADF